MGALDDCVGSAALYLSTDGLRSWHYAGTLFSQIGLNSSFLSCLPPPPERDLQATMPLLAGRVPPGARGYGGPCDQFGTR